MNRMTLLFKMDKSISTLLAALMLLIVSACDTTNVATDQDISGELDVPAAALIEGLDLSNSQAQQVAEIMSKYDTKEPGRLWYVSAELQETLSDDQIEELIASVDETEGNLRGQRTRTKGQRGQRGMRSPGNLESLENPLTDEQKEQVKALREEQRESMKTLMQQRRDGSVSDEDFKAQMEEARETMKAALEDILTAEQLSELEAKRAEFQENRGTRGKGGDGSRIRGNRGSRGEGTSSNREDFQAAMIDALDLTTEQQEQLKQVREDMRSQMQELRGEIDRDNREAARESIQALHESAKEKTEAVFTEEQQEIMAIHRALMFEVRSTINKRKKI